MKTHDMSEEFDQWGYPIIEPIRNPDNEADDFDQWGYMILPNDR